MSDDGCRFGKAWIGRCGAPVERDGLCHEHLTAEWADGSPRYRCWCGGQATHDCANTSQFVCGMPLCDEHKCNQKGRMFWHSEEGRDQWDAWRQQRGEPMTTKVWEGTD